MCMFRKSFLLCCSLCLPFFLCAQEIDLQAFNTERLSINKTGMGILGSWALTNMAVSALSLRGTTAEIKAFHQMNLGWNAVNLLIAGIGYYAAVNEPIGEMNMSESIQAHEKMKSILLFNAGLDLAYVTGGFYLLERAKNSTSRSDQLRGFGKAVIMNGSFLFVFDVVMVWLHAHHAQSKLYALASVLTLQPGGLTFNFRF